MLQSVIQHTDYLTSLVLIIWLAPLLSSFISLVLIPSKYEWVCPPLASLLLLISSITGLILFFQSEAETVTPSISWFTLGNRSIDLGFLIDGISLPTVLIVNIISFLVHAYSISYMADDTRLKRYFGILGLFTFSMTGLVISNNLLLTFIFWELVGFSSYILIGHWSDKRSAGLAAQKAFLINRLADISFIIGLLIIWTNQGSFDIKGLETTATTSWQTAGSLCLLISVLGKSAQFPFFNWLPDAMEGPTPVSALIHAATMVAAGVFLLVRVHFIFTPTVLDIAAIIGALTALIGAASALSQFDIKRILAYSTISQLGFMILAFGSGSYESAYAHLLTHAFFKAGLFLVAGSVLHALHHYQKNDFDIQDIRNLGGLHKQLPITTYVAIACGAALMGLPLFSGFISKDAILTSVWIWSQEEPWRLSILIISVLVSFTTVAYTFRFIWFVFFSKSATSFNQVSESPWAMRFTMIVLAICSFWFILSANPFATPSWISIDHNSGITIFSILWVLLALAASWLYFRKGKPKSFREIFQQGFYLDAFYKRTTNYFIKTIPPLTNSIDKKWIDGFIHSFVFVQVGLAHLVAWFDQFIIDGIVNAGASTANAVGSLTRSFQGGRIQLYIFWMLIGLIIFLFFSLI